MQTVIEIDAMDMLSLSILVLFLGNFLNRKVRILGDNYIPAAVTGGLLFALVNLGLYSLADTSIEFEMRFRDFTSDRI